MVYTIAIFPKFHEIKKINAIRKKYDPTYKFLDPHIALVYYFEKKPEHYKISRIVK